MSKTDYNIWRVEEEELLVMWAEKAAGFAWLHSRSGQFYSKRGTYIGIPSSIISVIASAAIFSTLNSTNDNAYTIQVGIGILNIIASIFSTLQSVLNYSETAEQHKGASSLFSSFNRNISAELTLPPGDRTNPKDFIRLSRVQYDKLIESSPNIPFHIIKRFNEKFKTNNVAKPDITNGIHKIITYANRTNTQNDLILMKTFYPWALKALRTDKSIPIPTMDDYKNTDYNYITPTNVIEMKHNLHKELNNYVRKSSIHDDITQNITKINCNNNSKHNITTNINKKSYVNFQTEDNESIHTNDNSIETSSETDMSDNELHNVNIIINK
jgi:hypothetical protein